MNGQNRKSLIATLASLVGVASATASLCLPAMAFSKQPLDLEAKQLLAQQSPQKPGADPGEATGESDTPPGQTTEGGSPATPSGQSNEGSTTTPTRTQYRERDGIPTQGDQNIETSPGQRVQDAGSSDSGSSGSSSVEQQGTEGTTIQRSNTQRQTIQQRTIRQQRVQPSSTDSSGTQAQPSSDTQAPQSTQEGVRALW